MDCATTPVANSLNYCTDEGGILSLGVLNAGITAAPIVVFENMASGRKEVAVVEDDAFPDIIVLLPADLSPGQVYRLSVVGRDAGVGMNPIPWAPYLYDPVTGLYTRGTEEVTAVVVRFQKLFTTNSVHSHEEQYITLAP